MSIWPVGQRGASVSERSCGQVRAFCPGFIAKKSPSDQKTVDKWWGKVVNCVKFRVEMEQQDTIGEQGGMIAQGVFVGTFVHSLDPKKRLTIPSGWREQVTVPNGLYVLPGVESEYLYVLPAQEIADKLKRIRGHSIADAKARQFARILGSQSDLVSWDSQGRIRIKDELLNHARLTDQVVLVGTFEGFELWNPESWKKTGSMDQSSLGEAARYVGF